MSGVCALGGWQAIGSVVWSPDRSNVELGGWATGFGPECAPQRALFPAHTGSTACIGCIHPSPAPGRPLTRRGVAFLAAVPRTQSVVGCGTRITRKTVRSSWLLPLPRAPPRGRVSQRCGRDIPRGSLGEPFQGRSAPWRAARLGYYVTTARVPPHGLQPLTKGAPSRGAAGRARVMGGPRGDEALRGPCVRPGRASGSPAPVRPRAALGVCNQYTLYSVTWRQVRWRLFKPHPPHAARQRASCCSRGGNVAAAGQRALRRRGGGGSRQLGAAAADQPTLRLARRRLRPARTSRVPVWTARPAHDCAYACPDARTRIPMPIGVRSSRAREVHSRRPSFSLANCLSVLTRPPPLVLQVLAAWHAPTGACRGAGRSSSCAGRCMGSAGACTACGARRRSSR